MTDGAEAQDRAERDCKRICHRGKQRKDGKGEQRYRLLAWQHPKSPQNEVLNIVEAPKNAASAILGASLGEDKYFLIFWLLTLLPLFPVLYILSKNFFKIIYAVLIYVISFYIYQYSLRLKIPTVTG